MKWWPFSRRSRAADLPPRNLFEGVPGPSPWYLRSERAPRIPGFRWKDEGASTQLVGSDGPVLEVGFYVWIQAIDESMLLAWHQAGRWDDPGPVHLTLLEPRRLPRLIGKLPEASTEGTRGLHFEGPPAAAMEMAIRNEDDIRFPAPLRQFSELLILCNGSTVRGEGGLQLLVARPDRGSCRVYPQDWFNDGDFDLGYEWVTRVTRDPATGRVHGEGIRIHSFVLDDTLRNVVP